MPDVVVHGLKVGGGVYADEEQAHQTKKIEHQDEQGTAQQAQRSRSGPARQQTQPDRYGSDFDHAGASGGDLVGKAPRVRKNGLLTGDGQAAPL